VLALRSIWIESRQEVVLGCEVVWRDKTGDEIEVEVEVAMLSRRVPDILISLEYHSQSEESTRHLSSFDAPETCLRSGT